MKTKNFFLSKVNWAAIILVLMACKDAIADMDFHAMDMNAWIQFALGMIIIVFRTWFTNSSISTLQPPANNESTNKPIN